MDVGEGCNVSQAHRSASNSSDVRNTMVSVAIGQWIRLQRLWLSGHARPCRLDLSKRLVSWGLLIVHREHECISNSSRVCSACRIAGSRHTPLETLDGWVNGDLALDLFPFGWCYRIFSLHREACLKKAMDQRGYGVAYRESQSRTLKWFIMVHRVAV
jgi:hypothetical protein